MPVKRFLLGALVAALLAAPAAAQSEFETRTLFRKGAWMVVLTHDTVEASLWCDANTTNRAGQGLSLTGYESGQFTIFVFDGSWNIADRPLRFLVDIDGSRWTMDGQGSGGAVSITPEDGGTAARFVGQIMAGNRVVVRNAEGRGLAEFSLNGSAAAVAQFIECWGSITGRGGGAVDPF